MKQYDVYLIALDPTLGHEISKVRPGVIVSPDEMNDILGTVLVAPLTSRSKPYPTRLPASVQGRDGWIALDQIRALDKHRLIKPLDHLGEDSVLAVKRVLKEMLVD